MTTYPTDATLRVSGITRTFWAKNKTYQATLNLGSNMTNYISPISGHIQSSIATNVTETPQIDSTMTAYNDWIAKQKFDSKQFPYSLWLRLISGAYAGAK